MAASYEKREGRTMEGVQPKGTDATFLLKAGRKVWNFAAKTAERREALIIPHYAESACVPLEGTTEGRAVIDGYLIGIGPVTEPVELVMRQGRAVEVNGGTSAARLRALMEAVDENASNIAECGICTSHKEKRAYEYDGPPGTSPMAPGARRTSRSATVTPSAATCSARSTSTARCMTRRSTWTTCV
jgi:leucyl aminopeptidase (aminopeptidase T)